MHISCQLFSSLGSLALGLVPDGQLGSSPHNGSVVLAGDVVSRLHIVRFVAHQPHCKLLEGTGEHVLGFLIAPVVNIGHKIWPLNLLCTLLSVPLGFHRLCLILTHRPDQRRMNYLVLFLTTGGFTRGLRASMTPNRRWLPPLQAAPRKSMALHFIKMFHTDHLTQISKPPLSPQVHCACLLP